MVNQSHVIAELVMYPLIHDPRLKLKTRSNTLFYKRLSFSSTLRHRKYAFEPAVALKSVLLNSKFILYMIQNVKLTYRNFENIYTTI